MKNSCRIFPEKGKSQFSKLRQSLGKDLAELLWNDVISHLDFLLDYKNTLVLDDEGIPTFDSIMENSYVKEYLGQEKIKNALENDFITRKDSPENYLLALLDALTFNKDPKDKNFIAIVDKSSKVIKIKLVESTDANRAIFANQFGVTTLNAFIQKSLKLIGITPELMEASGINGITDFSKAQTLANNLIQVANNLLGDIALSEEFSHLCLEVFKDNPLVARIKNIISNNPNIVDEILGLELVDEYLKKYLDDPNKIVEEAMGHMLQESFFKGTNIKQAESLFSKLVNFIKNFFKRLNSDSLTNAVYDSKTAMDLLAKDILLGELKITRESVSDIHRTDKLYSLETQSLKLSLILSASIDAEVKMAKINDNEEASAFIEQLLGYLNDGRDTALGVCRYLENVTKQLTSLSENFKSATLSSDNRIKFGYLRKVNNYLKMYAPILSGLSDFISESKEDDALGILSRTFTIDNKELTIQDLVRNVKELSDSLLHDYSRVAMSSMANFLKPFMGENVTNPFASGVRTVSIDALLEEAENDISWVDTWLTSMSLSQDALLLIFNLVAMEAKDRARINTISISKLIQSAYLAAKNNGVTDFKFMYRYVDGLRTNLYIGTSEEIDNLTDAQRDFYYTFINLKERLDNLLDNKYANPTHVILIKKDFIYGGLGLIALGKFHEAGEFYKDKVFEREYDDLSGYGRTSIDNEGYYIDESGNRIIDEFGNFIKATEKDFSTRKVLKGFDGKEYMLVPKYYLRDLADQDDVSDDPLSSLIAYAYMANNYKEISEVANILETGREVLKDRKVRETRGSKRVKEIFNWNGFATESDVYKEWDKTNIAKKLDAFFNSQIYGRYLKDEGVIKLGDKNLSIQKLTSTLLGASSHILLGFNWLANTANVANGIAMSNIETACKLFFRPKNLSKADRIYALLLPEYMKQLNNPVKTSKLALIGEYFNTKLNFDENVKVRYDRSLLSKIFGPNIAFIGLDAGDHWLYNRVAIAMLLETEVKDAEGNTANLYDALEVVTDDNGVARLQIKDGWDCSNIKYKDRTSNIFSIMSRRIANVNLKLFGVYNQDDLVAAQLVAIGRLALQYRKWIIPAMNKRWETARYNVLLDLWEEGYYRTILDYLNLVRKEIARGEYLLLSVWNSLSNEQQVNIKRAATEVFLYIALIAAIGVLSLAGGDDKKRRPWLSKFLDYLLHRLKTEMGVLVPGPMMAKEALTIILSPAASLSYIERVMSIVDAVTDVKNWGVELLTGPYKGMTRFGKAVYLNTPYIQSVVKATKGIDQALQFYSK